MIAIIQARLKSTRLPNKAMLDICGKPMLGRVIDRIKMAIPDIIVATPDKEIAEYAESQGVGAFIGSESNVLDRYYQAAIGWADVARITSDCPLIDPDVINRVVEHYHKGFDYVSNIMIRTYPKGLDVEVFSFNTLEKAWRRGRGVYDREHVTPYIYNHPDLFKLGNVENDNDLSHLWWTVDYERDLEFAREIYSNLGGNFTMKDVLKYTDGGA